MDVGEFAWGKEGGRLMCGHLDFRFGGGDSWISDHRTSDDFRHDGYVVKGTTYLVTHIASINERKVDQELNF